VVYNLGEVYPMVLYGQVYPMVLYGQVYPKVVYAWVSLGWYMPGYPSWCICLGTPPGVYAPCTSLGTPLYTPASSTRYPPQDSSDRLTALEHHVTETNISDAGVSVTQRFPFHHPFHCWARRAPPIQSSR